MNAKLTDPEIKCVKQLAELFEQGSRDQKSSLLQRYRVEERESVLAMMKSLGVITVNGDMHDRYADFKIMPRVVQLAREIGAQEQAPTDLVEQMKLTFRRNPWTAWPIIIAVVIVFLATAVNQIVGALKAIGWLAP